MDWECGVVWFDDCVWHFWWWDDWECLHDSVWILLSDLGDEQCAHTRSGTTSQWVGDLESLQAIASLSLLSNYIQDWVDQLCTFSVVTLGPVVTSSCLSEHEVVWSEQLSEWSCSDRVHCSWKMRENSYLVPSPSKWLLGRIFLLLLRCSKRWFFPIEDQNLRGRYLLGRYRVHLKWLPRIWHRFGYHIVLLEYERFLSLWRLRKRIFFFMFEFWICN